MGLTEPGYILLFGRLHPLILHFPVSLLIISALLEVIPRITGQKYGTGYNIALWIVLCMGSLSAVTAASMGYTLYQTGSYDGATVNMHMQFGVSVAVLSVIAVLLKLYSEEKSNGLVAKLYGVSLTACVFAIFMAGHYGGALTHGSEFLPSAAPEPIASWLRHDDEGARRKVVVNDQFSTTILPIIQENCASCHGDSKQEGGLRFDDHGVVMAGGESGLPAIVPGKALASEMVRRLFLPRSDKKAMPPDGRARPSDAQLVAIMDWIEAGAPWEGESSGPTELMADYLGANAEPASAEALAVLDAAGVSYFPLSNENSLLNIDLSLKRFEADTIINILSTVKGQVAWLNLSFNDLNGDIIELVADLPNLTRLSLSETGIDDDIVAPLRNHQTLTSLNLTGTQITANMAAQFKEMPLLQTLFIWDTSIEADDVQMVKDTLSNVNVIAGGGFISAASETE